MFDFLHRVFAIALLCNYFWVNYSNLTATSLGIPVNKGNHPQMALIQVTELV